LAEKINECLETLARKNLGGNGFFLKCIKYGKWILNGLSSYED